MVVPDGEASGHDGIHRGDSGARHHPGTQEDEHGAEGAPAAHVCVSSTHARDDNEMPPRTRRSVLYLNPPAG